ncbi:MAG: hypothetical protein Q4E47_02200, partial [Candidatus Saccharibacteria bacterium]|nr:hypothetical protein [Candidatus Saccharibacteria bacterium]
PKEEEQKEEKTQEGLGNILEREGPDTKQILIYVFAGIAAVTSIALAIVIMKLVKCQKSQKPSTNVTSDHNDDESIDSIEEENHTDPYADDKRPLGSPDKKSEH